MNFGTELDNVYGDDYGNMEYSQQNDFSAPASASASVSASASASAPPMPKSSSSQSVENEEMSHMGLMDPRPPPSPLLVKDKDKENVNDVNHRIDAMERRINETIRKTKVNHNKGIISTLVSRKRDALKLLSLSLMILLAISMHSFFEYCIKDYMMNSFVDPQKERTIRVMYPIVVFLSMWILKGIYL